MFYTIKLNKLLIVKLCIIFQKNNKVKNYFIILRGCLVHEWYGFGIWLSWYRVENPHMILCISFSAGMNLFSLK